MSLPDAEPSHRNSRAGIALLRRFALVGAAASVLLAAGCTVRPLYSDAPLGNSNVSAKAELAYRTAEARRYEQLGTNVVSTAQKQEVASAMSKAAAAAKQTEAALDLARFNLERTEVKATVDGYVTNLQMKTGNYVAAGQAVVALIDSHSFYVMGYFEETKLPRIHVGAPVSVRIMGAGADLRGRVDSITRAIVDRDRAEGTGLVANVNPTFNWVRLAQRIPVRIALDEVPDGLQLVAGRTATVSVIGSPDSAPKVAQLPAGR